MEWLPSHPTLLLEGCGQSHGLPRTFASQNRPRIPWDLKEKKSGEPAHDTATHISLYVPQIGCLEGTMTTKKMQVLCSDRYALFLKNNCVTTSHA